MPSRRENPVKTWLEVDEPAYDPWEWTRSIQRERMSRTCDGRIVQSWTGKKSLIAGLLAMGSGVLLVTLLRMVLGYETVRAIVIAGYAMATVVAIVIGSVLEIQLR
ncbi:hypothetical protein IFR05_006317 [Cadophora sp. M221]|nr:hypothetical protein IFR05_006317 [Cadophora sp. M221]